MVGLGRNSLTHSFLDAATKQRLLTEYDKRVANFARQFQTRGWQGLRDVHPVSYQFTCKHYQLCIQ
jgi:adenosine deaminase CECR1